MASFSRVMSGRTLQARCIGVSFMYGTSLKNNCVSIAFRTLLLMCRLTEVMVVGRTSGLLCQSDRSYVFSDNSLSALTPDSRVPLLVLLVKPNELTARAHPLESRLAFHCYGEFISLGGNILPLAFYTTTTACKNLDSRIFTNSWKQCSKRRSSS